VSRLSALIQMQVHRIYLFYQAPSLQFCRDFLTRFDFYAQINTVNRTHYVRNTTTTPRTAQRHKKINALCFQNFFNYFFNLPSGVMAILVNFNNRKIKLARIKLTAIYECIRFALLT